MSFVPYLYAAFNEYHSTGKPPIRALVLDWPEDPKVRQIDDEFMFGEFGAGRAHVCRRNPAPKFIFPPAIGMISGLARKSAAEKPLKRQIASNKFPCS